MRMMGFPSGTEFSIYSALRNTTESPISIDISFNYMGSKGPITTLASHEELAPLQSVQLDVNRLLKEAGLSHFNGMLNLMLAFTGSGGDLIVASGSVDNTGTYVFAVQPQGLARSLGKEVSYWSVNGDDDTMIGLMNGGDAARDFTATFFFSGGHYKLPFHLGAGESINLDMAEIIAAHRPDAGGNVIPESVPQGSAIFSSAQGEMSPMSLAVSVGVFNVRTATCGGPCVNYSGYTQFYLAPDNYVLNFGKSLQLRAYGVFHDDLRNTDRIDALSPAPWAVNVSSSIATISQSGLVQASTTAGDVIASAQEDLFPDGGVVSTDCSYQCPADYVWTAYSDIIVQHATPTNYRQTQGYDSGNGVITFQYSWDSTSGTIGDLSDCVMREYVTYDGTSPFLWPSPPFVYTSTDFPVTAGGPGNGANNGANNIATAPDSHGHPNFKTPYAPASISSTQYYQYICPGINAGQPVNVMGPLTITRSVVLSGGSWVYAVQKSGVSASTILP